jgi:hypothetical protein
MNKIMISTLMFAILGIGIGTITQAQAGGKSAYESGYDHGCDDSNKSYNNKYINESGKGPSFHTEESMRGYNAGTNCSNSNDNNNNDNDNRNQERQKQP